MVDADRKASMGFIYRELKKAKKDIRQALNNVESNYQPILDIIDSRMPQQIPVEGATVEGRG